MTAKREAHGKVQKSLGTTKIHHLPTQAKAWWRAPVSGRGRAGIQRFFFLSTDSDLIVKHRDYSVGVTVRGGQT